MRNEKNRIESGAGVDQWGTRYTLPQGRRYKGFVRSPIKQGNSLLSFPAVAHFIESNRMRCFRCTPLAPGGFSLLGGGSRRLLKRWAAVQVLALSL